MLHFLRYESYEGFKRLKQLSRSLKVNAIGAIRQATYNFLLVFHCKYVGALYHFLLRSSCYGKKGLVGRLAPSTKAAQCYDVFCYQVRRLNMRQHINTPKQCTVT